MENNNTIFSLFPVNNNLAPDSFPGLLLGNNWMVSAPSGFPFSSSGDIYQSVIVCPAWIYAAMYIRKSTQIPGNFFFLHLENVTDQKKSLTVTRPEIFFNISKHSPRGVLVNRIFCKRYQKHLLLLLLGTAFLYGDQLS